MKYCRKLELERVQRAETYLLRDKGKSIRVIEVFDFNDEPIFQLELNSNESANNLILLDCQRITQLSKEETEKLLTIREVI